ncbi:hypothetical protein BKA93DRAFT_357079 [Sparassis latifolia]|uniref:Uncharacterized protein n=1 Tax=Sparassis crispa TaxID=139825 RepID=A0A401GMI1_9APHY|nr:predicted protein [Sparassis crispa]GBE83437.1 predicted protein [Sparassis crispa]
MMPTGRSSTASARLRSKTSDLTDLLRGGRSELKQPAIHLTPSVPPPAEPTPPSKGKRRIDILFLGRKRKSSSVSPSSFRRSQDNRTDQEDDIPPVPSVDTSRPSNSNATGRRSSSTPSSPQTTSLTTVDEAPSSGTFAHLFTSRIPPRTGSSSHAANTHKSDSAKSSSSLPLPSLRHLRPQKSTSFEHGRRSTDNRRSNDSSRQSAASTHPTITISAPPSTAGDVTPRPAPAPPPAIVPRTARRNFGIPRDYRTSQSSPQSSPTSPRPKMQFTTPAAEYARLQMSPKEVSFPRISKEHAEVDRQSESESVKTSLASSKDRVHKHISALPLSAPRYREKSYTLAIRRGYMSDSTSGANMSDSDAAPSSPTTPTRSRIPATVSALRSATGKIPPPLLTTFRRPPSSGPPTDPLPSPPPSIRSGDEAGSSISALPTIPSFPSVGARRSATSLQQSYLRERANTNCSHTSLSAAKEKSDTTATAPSSSTDWSEAERDVNKPLPTPIVALQESGDESASALGDVATPEQLRDALNAQSAKFARLSAYLLTVTEKHAAEKSELTRRIEVLEREARKREREITGLRWLVMNAGQNAAGEPGGTTAKTAPRIDSAARFRSGSKSSQKSQASHRSSHGETRGPMSVDSHTGSMEEGLIELQNSVSDFIAPATSPPGTAMGASPSPNPSISAVTGRLRRSNTLPDGPAQLPDGLLKQKQTRRTSSPVMPASASVPATSVGTSASSIPGAGLGLDLPSIPSLPGSDSGQSSFSLPSLTATNTASSGLSAIPETPLTPGATAVDPAREREKRAKEERRASRALKRISASTTSSSMSTSTAYSSNLKLGASPSIGQVLDRATESDSDMEVILRRLQGFNGPE